MINMGFIERSTRLPVMYGIVVCTVTIGTLFVSSSIDQSTRSSKQYENYNSAAQRAARKLMEKQIISDKAINVLEKFPLHKEYFYDDSYSSLQYDINRMENLLQFFHSSESYDYSDSILDLKKSPEDKPESSKQQVDDTDKQLSNRLPSRQSEEFQLGKPFVANQPIAEQSQKTNQQTGMAPKQSTNKLDSSSKQKYQSSAKQQLTVNQQKEKLQAAVEQEVDLSGRQDTNADQHHTDQQETGRNEPEIHEAQFQSKTVFSNGTPSKEQNPPPNRQGQSSNFQLGVSQQRSQNEIPAGDQQLLGKQKPPTSSSNQAPHAQQELPANQPQSLNQAPPENPKPPVQQQPSANKPPATQQQPVANQQPSSNQAPPANPQSSVNQQPPANQGPPAQQQPVANQQLSPNQAPPANPQSPVNQQPSANQGSPAQQQPIANQQPSSNQAPPANPQPPVNQQPSANQAPPAQQQSLANQQPSPNQAIPANPQPPVSQQPSANLAPPAQQQSLANQQPSPNQAPPANPQPPVNQQPSANQGSPAQQQPIANQQPSSNQEPPTNPQSPVNQQPSANQGPPAQQQSLANQQPSPNQAPPTNPQSPVNQQPSANQGPPAQQQSIANQQPSPKQAPPANSQSLVNQQPSANQGPPAQQQPLANEEPSNKQGLPANPQPHSKQQPTFDKKSDANQEDPSKNQIAMEQPLKNQQKSPAIQKPIVSQEQPPEQLSDKALVSNPQPPTSKQSQMAAVQNGSSNVDRSQNDSCISIKLMPKDTMPLVALLSSPGSGNTWTRFLIEHATGIYTGSVYDDYALYKGGFHGEFEDVGGGTVVVVKTHFFPKSQEYEYRKVILLIRNPYNCILSEFNRQKGQKGVNKSHISYADPSLFQTSNWTQYAKGAADRWFQIMQTALKTVKPSNVLIVFYESLLTDVAGPLKNIVRFLGLPVQKSRLECTKRIADKSSFHRPHKSLGFDPYNEELTSRIKSNIEKARQLVLQNYNTTFPKYEKETFK